MQYFRQDLFAPFIMKWQRFYPLLMEQWQRWLISALNALLAILIVSTVLYQGYQIFTLMGSQSNAEKKVGKNTHAQNQVTRPTGIAQWHLFGMPPPPPPLTAERVKTQWKVTGIILGSKPQSNLAILSSAPNQETIYQSGDRLPDGSVISKILPDQVVLGGEGSSETLVITWDSKAQAEIPAQVVKNESYTAAPDAPPPPANDKEP